MRRSQPSRLRTILLTGSALTLVTVVVPSCSDGTGNPPVGSINSPKKPADVATPPAGAKPGAALGDKFGGDR